MDKQTTYSDFEALTARGIVRSRMTLWRLIREFGFPPGIMVGGRRLYLNQEIDAWLAACPTAPIDKAAPGGAA